MQSNVMLLIRVTTPVILLDLHPCSAR